VSKYNKNKVAIPGATTDQFITFGQRILNGLVARAGMIGVLIIVALVVIIAAWGYGQFAGARREKASEMLAQATKIYHAELLGDKDAPATSDDLPRFKTAKERADAALSALDKLKAEYPRSEANLAGTLARAGILYDQARYPEADAAYRQFLEKKPADPALVALAKEGLGLCAEAQGKPEAALSIYKEQGGEFYKDRFLFDQARVLLKKGEKKQAAELYKEILTKMPTSPLRDEANNRLLALED
jgi:predicted negative regulator of RcsB-dependent stress response